MWGNRKVGRYAVPVRLTLHSSPPQLALMVVSFKLTNREHDAMTNQLISVFDGSISNETALLCNARDLHKFLGVGKVFAAWITSRISDYGFIENQDYILLSNLGKQTSGRGGYNRKEYHLTLDTAKELAMVERNDKGRQVRRYFIDCEKQLKHPAPAFDDEKPIMHTINLTDEELCSLCWLWSAAEYMRESIEEICPALKMLDSNKSSSFSSMALEYKRTLNNARLILKREVCDIELRPRSMESSNWRYVLPRIRKTAF